MIYNDSFMDCLYGHDEELKPHMTKAMMDELYGPLFDPNPSASEASVEELIKAGMLSMLKERINIRRKRKKLGLEFPDITDPTKWVKKKRKNRGRKKKNRRGGGASKRRTVMQRSNWSCHYCGVSFLDETVKMTLDHLMPKCQGGKNGNKNLVACCNECNQSKADLSRDMFLTLRPDLKAKEQDLNYLNGMDGRFPWSGNPYSDLYNDQEFWSNYFGG